MKDFSPVFSTIKEWRQLELVIDLTIEVNKIIDKLESEISVEKVFGRGLLNVYEQNFKIKIPDTLAFQTSKLSFQKVKLQYI